MRALFQKSCAVMLAAVLGMLSGCAGAKDAAAPAVTIAPGIGAYENMTWQEFLEQTGQEAEFYHATFYSAKLPDSELSAVFSGEYDEELAGAVLQDDSRCVRLEGPLAYLLTDVDDELEAEKLAEGLAWSQGEVLDCTYAEGAGTAYYVADKYAVIRFDSNGDGSKDAVLEISLDQTTTIGPDSYAWLRWIEE